MTLRVTVAVAWRERQEVVELELPEGSSIADAVAAARGRLGAAADFSGMQTGIWSRACPPGTRLRDGDRVELYRPLEADAKQMRRARARRGR